MRARALARRVAVALTGPSCVVAGSDCSSSSSTDEFRVLVVGGGLGGCLCAKELRRRCDASGTKLVLHVWERASYCAGRFGALGSSSPRSCFVPSTKIVATAAATSQPRSRVASSSQAR